MVFTPYQQQEIDEGIREGLDVSVYAKPELLAIQMRQIRFGMEKGLPMEPYADRSYDWFQLEEIRLGLEKGIDVTKYDKADIAFDVMRQIRLGLESGIDLSVATRYPAGILKQFRLALKEHVDLRTYIRAGYEEEQLEEIRLALGQGIEIEPYLSPAKRGTAIREIAAGLDKGLDVSVYAKDELGWQQMRELRLGMEKRLDISVYNKPLYAWQQMQEIRLGMEAHLDVSQYASMMYTAGEMHRKRLKLLAEKELSGEETAKQDELDKISYEKFLLMISEDWMDASVFLVEDACLPEEEIMQALKNNGITTGIDKEALKRLGQGASRGDIITIAKGTPPQVGPDGRYEYFFDAQAGKKPKLLEDGEVDYQNMQWYDIVKKDQKIACYHSAKAGAEGVRINGEIIPGLYGKELSALEERGIVLLSDQKTYLSAMDGTIEMMDGMLVVTNVLVLQDVTASDEPIQFSGSIHVTGNIESGARIEAQNNIVVEGFTGGAALSAGGNIILAKGCNAGGRGMLFAKGSVMGSFFENANVKAEVDIKANYCLNSRLHAGKNVEIAGTHGKLAGGMIQAGNRVVSQEIGNASGIATEIAVGKKTARQAKKQQLFRRSEEIKKELTLLKNAYEQFRKKFAAEVRNTNPGYLKLEAAMYTLENEQRDIECAMTELEQRAMETRQVSVSARGILYRGVQIDIDGAKWKGDTMHNVSLKNRNGKISLSRND